MRFPASSFLTLCGISGALAVSVAGGNALSANAGFWSNLFGTYPSAPVMTTPSVPMNARNPLPMLPGSTNAAPLLQLQPFFGPTTPGSATTPAQTGCSSGYTCYADGPDGTAFACFAPPVLVEKEANGKVKPCMANGKNGKCMRCGSATQGQNFPTGGGSTDPLVGNDNEILQQTCTPKTDARILTDISVQFPEIGALINAERSCSASMDNACARATTPYCPNNGGGCPAGTSCQVGRFVCYCG